MSANQTSAGNVIKELIRSSQKFPDGLIKNIDNYIESSGINTGIIKLEELLNSLKQDGAEIVTLDRQISNRSKLSKLFQVLSVDENGSVQATNLLAVAKEQSKVETKSKEIAETGNQMYELILTLLEKIGLIDHVNIQLVYATKTRFVLFDEKTSLDLMRDNVRSEVHRNAVNIRLQSSKIAAKGRAYLGLNKSNNMSDQIVSAMNALSAHYQVFTLPYFKWQRTHNKWKINMGIVSEAFVRHLESTPHRLNEKIEWNKPLINKDIGSNGERWQLYRKSSGNAPFYTGADTIFSQVKMQNASLISNIDTIIDSAEIIIKIFGKNIKDEKELKQVVELIQKTFSQGEIPEKVGKEVENTCWELIDETLNSK